MIVYITGVSFKTGGIISMNNIGYNGHGVAGYWLNTHILSDDSFIEWASLTLKAPLFEEQ